MSQLFYKSSFVLDMMKLLVVGDLHGQKPKIRFKDFDAIVCIGDICSDKYKRKLFDKWMKSEWNKSKEERLNFDDYVKKILKLKKSDLNKFDRLSLKDGRKIMEFLNSFGKPVFFIPGNWDQSRKKVEEYNGKDDFRIRKNIIKRLTSRNSNPKLIKNLKNVRDCQLRIRKFNGFNIIGYGISSGPEFIKNKEIKWNSKIKKEYLKLFNLLKSKYLKRNKKLPTIFLSHNVPYDTKLDMVRKKGSPVDGEHYGSVIARDFILKYKPLLCIGGHMHEYFGKTKLGKTTAINAGFGTNVNTLIELDEKKGTIKKITFKKG